MSRRNGGRQSASKVLPFTVTCASSQTLPSSRTMRPPFATAFVISSFSSTFFRYVARPEK